MSERLPAGQDERAGRAQAARTLGLVPSFDGLRAVAVILICTYHLELFIHPVSTELPGLFVGVNIFFVLSGFLITAIMLREHDSTGRIRLRPFYEGRVLRLFPALFAMVAVEFVWSVLLHYPLDYELKAVASALTYSSNWGLHMPWSFNFMVAARDDVGMVQLWSLAVEEQFYLIWPIVLIGLLAITKRFKWAPMVLVALAIVFVMVHRMMGYVAMPASEFRQLGFTVLYQRTDYRADDLLWGVLLALFWVRGWVPRRGLKLAGSIGFAILAATVFVATQQSGWVYVWGLPVMAIATVAVVLALLETDSRLKRVLETRWLCAVGMVSYGIYVWHVLIYQMVLHAVPRWSAGLQVAISAVLLATVTVASWFFVEKPFLRVKDRLRRRSTDLAGTREVEPMRAEPGAGPVDAEVLPRLGPSATVAD